MIDANDKYVLWYVENSVFKIGYCFAKIINYGNDTFTKTGIIQVELKLDQRNFIWQDEVILITDDAQFMAKPIMRLICD